MQTVSLCMIVKNEEKTLPRCLESVKGVFDEIVIADTGSTDGTVKAAEKYTDKVCFFKWCNDFSAARNFAFSKASCDYIMWLDADDVILPGDREKLLALKDSLTGREDVVMMPYHTALDKNGMPAYSFYRERIMRRACGFKWRGRVHEAVEYGGRVIYGGAAVTHMSAKKEYGTRNLDIYLLQKRLGEPFSPRDLFYFGRELYYNSRFDEACAVLSEFLDDGRGWIENNIEACRVLAACLKAKGNENGAVLSLFRSFLYDAPRAEVCCDIGFILLEKGQYENAAFWYRAALNAPSREKSGAFVQRDMHGFVPAIQLAVCLDRLGKYAEAARFNELAGSYKPDSPEYLANRRYFARVTGNEKGLL